MTKPVSVKLVCEVNGLMRSSLKAAYIKLGAYCDVETLVSFLRYPLDMNPLYKVSNRFALYYYGVGLASRPFNDRILLVQDLRKYRQSLSDAVASGVSEGFGQLRSEVDQLTKSRPSYELGLDFANEIAAITKWLDTGVYTAPLVTLAELLGKHGQDTALAVFAQEYGNNSNLIRIALETAILHGNVAAVLVLSRFNYQPIVRRRCMLLGLLNYVNSQVLCE